MIFATQRIISTLFSTLPMEESRLRKFEYPSSGMTEALDFSYANQVALQFA
jgi:hypothetical protein